LEEEEEDVIGVVPAMRSNSQNAADGVIVVVVGGGVTVTLLGSFNISGGMVVLPVVVAAVIDDNAVLALVPVDVNPLLLPVAVPWTYSVEAVDVVVVEGFNNDDDILSQSSPSPYIVQYYYIPVG
jgi:hypothetical protein